MGAGRRNYVVYFSVFGKKMKTTVLAENEIDATAQVKSKIEIITVKIKDKDVFNEAADVMDKFIDALK